MTSRRSFTRGTAALLALAASAAFAQAYPDKPLRIIVAYPPGQSTDTSARYFAAKLSAALGQGVVVENRSGAFGNIGTAYAARATPDGYTLIMGASGTHAMNPALYDKPGFDADKDFEPIAATAIIPMLVSVNPALGVHSLRELLALAKSRPDKIDVAIPSVTAQLVLESLKQREVPLFGVKYKGSADAMTALLGNQVSVLIDTVVASRPQFSKIRPLAVTSARAMTALPEVPSVAEQGVPGFEVTAWNTLMVPRGVPVEIRNRLAAEMKKIQALPETAKALHDLGFEAPPPMDYDQMVAWMRGDRAKYAEIVKVSGMKAE